MRTSAADPIVLSSHAGCRPFADRRRLLVILPSTGRGGAEEYALTIVRAASSDWDVVVATRHIRAMVEVIADLTAAGVRWRPLAQSQSASTYFEKARSFTEELIGMRRMLQEERPDTVLLVLPTPFVAVAAQVACRLSGRPLGVVFQLVPPSAPASWIRSLLAAWLHRRQQWVAVSAHNRGMLAQIFGVNAGKIAVIANGAPLPCARHQDEEWSTRRFRGELCESLRISQDRRLLLTVARLTPQKGHAVLIAAIPEVLTRHSDVAFLWAGDGPIESELRTAVQRAGLEDRVHFLGQRSDVPMLLKAADLFVFPTCYEGQPFALLEAMRHGVPIVSTSASGIGEVITDGVHGFLAPPGDPQALARRINDALSAPDLCQELALAAQHRAPVFSEEAMVDRTLALLRSLSEGSDVQSPTVITAKAA